MTKGHEKYQRYFTCYTHIVDISRHAPGRQARCFHIRQIGKIEAVVKLQKGKVVPYRGPDIIPMLDFPLRQDDQLLCVNTLEIWVKLATLCNKLKCSWIDLALIYSSRLQDVARIWKNGQNGLH